MSLKSVVEGYFLEIVGRAQAGEARCRKLVAAEFVSKAPRNLAQALLNVFRYLPRVAAVIVERIDWKAAQDIIENDITTLRVLDAQLKEFSAHIRYVESARTDRLPWQVIPSFEKLVAHLRPGAQVMLRPMWHYNYATIISNLRDEYVEQLQEFEFFLPDVDVASQIVAPLDDAFHIISFPALERDNILLHSLIGHEIGHLLAIEYVERWEGDFLAKARAAIETATDHELKKNDMTEESLGPLIYPQVRAKRITENSRACLRFWARGLEEILADVVGATLFGPAALFSTLEVAVQIGFDLPPTPRNNFYPPWRTRIREVLRVVESIAADLLIVDPKIFRLAAPVNLLDRADTLRLTPELRVEFVQDRITTIREIAASSDDDAALQRSPLATIAYEALREYIDAAAAAIVSAVGKRAFNQKHVLDALPALIERLDAGITPNADNDMPSRRPGRVGLVEVLNSAWYHKASLSITEMSGSDRERLELIRAQRNRLTLKAIEYSYLAEEHPARQPRQLLNQLPPTNTGVLTRDDLHDWMERSPILDRLVITPLLDVRRTLGDTAIDVRLGTEFILFRKEAFHSLDITDPDALVGEVGQYQQRIVRNIREPLVLHPNQMVIGSTLEYIQVPRGLMAYVAGKSTWGRTGLVIATAIKVDPGFRGCITLEIINEGEVPLVLVPGIPVAQLVFHRTERPVQYTGVYSCPIGPEFPRFDAIIGESAFWLPRRKGKT